MEIYDLGYFPLKFTEKAKRKKNNRKKPFYLEPEINRCCANQRKKYSAFVRRLK